MMNETIQTLERKNTIENSSPRRFSPLRKAAAHLSRKNLAGAKAEVLNQAMERLTELCYETDGYGFCNIDQETGRILIPMPCGRLGHRYWGLYTTEAYVLRILLYDLTDNNVRPSLYYYDHPSRSWYVNLSDYPTYDSALFWLSRNVFTVKHWKSGYKVHRDSPQ